MKHLKKIAKLTLIILMLCVPVLLQAQGDFHDDTQDNPFPVPFDDGIYCLIAVAVGYGLIKAYTKKIAIQNKPAN